MPYPTIHNVGDGARRHPETYPIASQIPQHLHSKYIAFIYRVFYTYHGIYATNPTITKGKHTKMDHIQIYTIKSNVKIAEDTFKMVLLGDTSLITAPGQFVNLQLDGLYLRRPISIHDWDEESFTIIYKVVGKGTEQMSKMEAGQKLDILMGLGNGYTVKEAQHVAVVGGGVGVPPLYALAKKLKAEGKHVTAVLGFGYKEQVFCEEEFKAVCDEVLVTTNDGSYGIKGFVTTAMEGKNIEYLYACGPEPMLKALHKTGIPGQLSFEARMGCGFGGCMGCSCKTLTGYKRICVEGPVMLTEEVTFDE